MNAVKEWRPGHYRVVCERSGRVCWDDEVRKEWDGTIVHEKYFEARHPQDLVRSRRDQKPVPIPRPEPPDQFVENYYEFGFDNGFHFNFAPDAPDTANYTKTATSSSVQGPASDFWDFTSDAKWYRNANGLLVQGSANEMVREFDMSGNLWGWLIEPKAKQNLMTYSDQFTAVDWSVISSTVTDNVIAGPTGAINAGRIVEAVGSSAHGIVNNRTLATSTVHATSCFFKAGARSIGVIRFTGTGWLNSDQAAYFDLRTGQVSDLGAGVTAYMERYADGWWRCVAVYTTAAATGTGAGTRYAMTTASNTQVYVGDGVSDIYIAGAQQEAGPVATSYIPTTTVAVTRAADRAYRLLGTEFDRTQGTYFARFRLGVGNKGGNQFVCISSDASYTNSASMLSSGTGLPQMSINSNAGFAGLSTASFVALTDRVDVRLAGGWTTDSIRTAINGSLGGLDAVAPVPLALTRMDLGTDFNGAAANSAESLWLQELHYWPEKKSDAFLQQRTSALL